MNLKNFSFLALRALGYSPRMISRRTKKELRAILEIIAPVLKDWLIGSLLFVLILAEMFFVFGFR